MIFAKDSRFPGCPFLMCNMEGKENGILVPVGEVEPMAEAMESLLTDEKLWEKYSRNAYKLTKELHPDMVNQKWEKYLLSIMKK